MPGATSNNPYYDHGDFPDELRDMMNEYHTRKEKDNATKHSLTRRSDRTRHKEKDDGRFSK